MGMWLAERTSMRQRDTVLSVVLTRPWRCSKCLQLMSKGEPAIVRINPGVRDNRVTHPPCDGNDEAGRR
jgi:hypothetical protein